MNKKIKQYILKLMKLLHFSEMDWTIIVNICILNFYSYYIYLADMDTGSFNVTNVFEFHNGRWYMVHHHSSVMNGDVEQQIMHG